MKCTCLYFSKNSGSDASSHCVYIGTRENIIEDFKLFCKKPSTSWAKLFDDKTGRILKAYEAIKIEQVLARGKHRR